MCYCGLLTLVGAWLGAFPILLDWNRPWQVSDDNLFEDTPIQYRKFLWGPIFTVDQSQNVRCLTFVVDVMYTDNCAYFVGVVS